MPKDVVISIKLKSYDKNLLQKTVNEILESIAKVSKGSNSTASNSSGSTSATGPIPLKTKSKRLVVRKSPFVNAKACRAFSADTHIRLIQLKNPNSALIAELNSVRPAPGVEVSVKV